MRASLNLLEILSLNALLCKRFVDSLLISFLLTEFLRQGIKTKLAILPFLLQLYLFWMFAHGVLAFEFKCPVDLHRHKRVTEICTENLVDHYSCLFDQNTNTYNESCIEPADFVRPGKSFYAEQI